MIVSCDFGDYALLCKSFVKRKDADEDNPISICINIGASNKTLILGEGELTVSVHSISISGLS